MIVVTEKNVYNIGHNNHSNFEDETNKGSSPVMADEVDDPRPEGPGFDPPTGDIIFTGTICMMDVG